MQMFTGPVLQLLMGSLQVGGKSAVMQAVLATKCCMLGHYDIFCSLLQYAIMHLS